MRRQIVPSNGGLVPSIVGWALALGRGIRRGLIRSVAIVAMLAIYVATSIGSIGTSALAVAGISSAALVGTATPADARRRRRSRRRWRHRRRWRPGFYWGSPWRWRRRRRRGRWRRRRRPGIYFHF